MFDQVKILARTYTPQRSDPVLTVSTTGTAVSDYCDPSSVLKNGGSTRLSYLEPGYFWLDGSYVAPSEDVTYPCGWVAKNPVTPASFQINSASTVSSFGISLVFDPDSIPSAFTIQYALNSTVKRTINVTGNTTATYHSNLATNLWNKVTITITTVPTGNRPRVRGVSFDWDIPIGGSTGTEGELTDIISCRFSKCIDAAGGDAPTGQLTFTMYNDDFTTRMSPLALVPSNPYGRMIKYRVYVRDSKVGGSWQFYNSYYTSTTDAYQLSEDGTTVTVSAQDGLYWLGSKDLVGRCGTAYGADGYSLSLCLSYVSAQSGFNITTTENITDLQWCIYDTTCREAIRKLCEATRCYVVPVENGFLRLVRVASGTTASYTFTNAYIVANSVSTANSKYTGTLATSHLYQLSAEKAQIALEQGIVMTGSKQHISISYDAEPVLTGSITVESSEGVTISDITAHPDHVEFDAIGTSGEQVYFAVNGWVLSDTEIVSRSTDPGSNPYKTETTLIPTQNALNTIRARIEAYNVNNPTITAEIFGSNDSASVGSVVELEDGDDSQTIIIESESYVLTDSSYSRTIGGRRYAGS